MQRNSDHINRENYEGRSVSRSSAPTIHQGLALNLLHNPDRLILSMSSPDMIFRHRVGASIYTDVEAAVTAILNALREQLLRSW